MNVKVTCKTIIVEWVTRVLLAWDHLVHLGTKELFFMRELNINMLKVVFSFTLTQSTA